VRPTQLVPESAEICPENFLGMMSNEFLSTDFKIHWFIFLNAIGMQFEKLLVLIRFRLLEILQAYLAYKKLYTIKRNAKCACKMCEGSRLGEWEIGLMS
jgi:hypothetical protein